MPRPAPSPRSAHGDSYALAETIIGPYSTELIRNRGPWKNLDDVEYAALEWIDSFNHRWLIQPSGHTPQAELEEMFYREEAPAEEAGLKRLSLHRTRGGLVFNREGFRHERP